MVLLCGEDSVPQGELRDVDRRLCWQALVCLSYAVWYWALASVLVR